MEQKEFYKINEVAELCETSHDTVLRWIKSGKLKAKKNGPFPGRTSRYLIPASEVQRLKKLIESKATLTTS